MCVRLKPWLSGSFEDSTRLFVLLFVLNVGFPVGLHDFHRLLSLQTVEHILAN